MIISEIEVARLKNIERAARRLCMHIRVIAYRDAAGLRLADAVTAVADLNEALSIQRQVPAAFPDEQPAFESRQ
jgi:pilus assembly protein TadC